MIDTFKFTHIKNIAFTEAIIPLFEQLNHDENITEIKILKENILSCDDKNQKININHLKNKLFFNFISFFHVLLIILQDLSVNISSMN